MRCDMVQQPLSGKRMFPSLGVSALIGLVLSAGSAYLCLLFAGAGHGAASPCHVFFGPLFAGLQFLPADELTRARYLNLVFPLMFVHYCGYALVISVGRYCQRGGLAWAWVLVFHYCGVGLCVLSDDWDGISNIWIISRAYGSWITVLLVEQYLGLHLLGCQYALSRPPYWPRITKRAGIMLVAGLVAGVAFHVLAITRAPG